MGNWPVEFYFQYNHYPHYNITEKKTVYFDSNDNHCVPELYLVTPAIELLRSHGTLF